jgi:hypothetical protein
LAQHAVHVVVGGVQLAPSGGSLTLAPQLQYVGSVLPHFTVAGRMSVHVQLEPSAG